MCIYVTLKQPKEKILPQNRTNILEKWNYP